MQMVILLLEKYIRYGQHDNCAKEIYPMGQNSVGTKVNKTKRYNKLHSHVQERHLHVADLEFVCHELVCVLAVGFAEVFVEHDAVADGQAAVDAVDQQEYQVSHILGLNHEAADREEHDECDADAADVAREALRLSFRAEIEQAEHQHTDDRHDQVRLVDESSRHARPDRASIHQSQRHQHRQRIPRRDAVDSVHEIDHIRRTYAHNQRNRHDPPHVPMHDPHAPEHQSHCSELHDQAHRIRQRPHIIPEAHPRHEQKPAQKRQIVRNHLPLSLHAHHHGPCHHRKAEDYAASTQHNRRM